MEEIDQTITDGIERMLKSGGIKNAPKRRVQFLLAQPQEKDLF
jgi:hypothetical protein